MFEDTFINYDQTEDATVCVQIYNDCAIYYLMVWGSDLSAVHVKPLRGIQ